MNQENNHEGFNEEFKINKPIENPHPFNTSQNQLQWTSKQVTALERELLLNNNVNEDKGLISNWIKVFLSAFSVVIPGVGQIVGIIMGLIFVSNDYNSDKRSFGAALLTVSLIAFILTAVFWFVFLLAFGQQMYY